VSTEELLEIGDRIVAMAKPGEEVEVVVGRSTSTEVRVYEGDVEQLATATTAGIGVRVIADHRQGFAYAGSLDPDVLAETLADARDNATFATPDEWLGLAEPDGLAVPDLDLFREEMASVPPRSRSIWRSLSRRPCAPPTLASPGSRRPTTPTASRRGRWCPPPASAPWGARRRATSRPTASPRRRATPRPASGSRWVACPTIST
jgi:hypothetical protein